MSLASTRSFVYRALTINYNRPLKVGTILDLKTHTTWVADSDEVGMMYYPSSVSMMRLDKADKNSSLDAVYELKPMKLMVTGEVYNKDSDTNSRPNEIKIKSLVMVKPVDRDCASHADGDFIMCWC